MRYHIDTIPVWDALHEDGECPLCLLRRRGEHLLTDRYLGASVMEPDTRIRVNAKGFCPAHQKMLYDKQNRLGHALMMHSHLLETIEKLAKVKPGSTGGRGSFFGLKKAAAGDEAGTGSRLQALCTDCALCDDLDRHMRSYAYTLIHLWKTDPRFQKEFLASKGVCLPDAALLMDMAPELLRGEALDSFHAALLELLRSSLARVEEELKWFTLKFDYRNQDKPWGNSRDALERAVLKLRGWSVGTDPGLDGK